MDHKLLLVNAIVLLYRESLLTTKTENSAELVRKILEDVQITDVNIGINRNRDVLLSLKKIALEMASNGHEQEYSKEQLLLTIKYACGEDDTTYDVLEHGIIPDYDEKKLKKVIIGIKQDVDKYFTDQSFRKLLDKASLDYRINRDKITNRKNFINEFCESLQALNNRKGEIDPAHVGGLDFSDTSSLTGVFKDIQKENSSEGILKLGHQLVNEELQGGLRRGEFVILSALQHSNKTGFILNMFKQTALYNTPYLYDKSKKPLLWFCALENSLNSCIMWLYQSLYENDTGSPYIINERETEEELTKKAIYVKERMGRNGFTVKIDRYDPTQWSYAHLCQKMTEFESDGFEVVAAFVDYLAMIPTTGCTAGAIGQDRRDQFRRVRNFTTRRKITFVTPHQLSQDAMGLVREGREDLVKCVVGRNYYDGCKTIGQECDLEIHINIEEYNGNYYQTVQRGKHRGVPVLIPKLRYGILPFFPIGGLRDDVEGHRTDIKKFGQVSPAMKAQLDSNSESGETVSLNNDW